MLRRTVRPQIAAPILLAVAAIGFIVANQAATAATQTPKTVWGDQQCLQCHRDTSTIKKMQEKKADTQFCKAAYSQLLKEQGGPQGPKSKTAKSAYSEK